MGLYGAVKRDFAAGQAYSGVPYDLEVVLLFSEVDPFIHAAAATGNYGPAGTIKSSVNYNAKYFLINGEAFSAGAAPIPAGSIGQNILLRFLNAGLQDYVPLTQGEYLSLVAEDGNLYPFAKRQYSTSCFRPENALMPLWFQVGGATFRSMTAGLIWPTT